MGRMDRTWVWCLRAATQLEHHTKSLYKYLLSKLNTIRNMDFCKRENCLLTFTVSKL